MKLWQKKGKLDPEVEGFTVGNDYVLDAELLPYDLKASKAHARMLQSCGYLTKKELKGILAVLDELGKLHSKGKFPIRPEDEDCHTAIENYLIKKLGEAGKKIHTARSRNDQSMTALRLLYVEWMKAILKEAKSLQKSIKAFAKKNKGQMPGYTHTRKAMPASVEMLANAYSDMLQDDTSTLSCTLKLLDKCPLGSAAGFGSPLEINRKMTAKELGFSLVQDNPIHCANSRGRYESAVTYGMLCLMQSLNRMATDLIYFTAPEFGFFSLPQELCTGSSIMPQKQNPDVLELVRAKAHVVHGNLVQINGMVMNLPSGYNRDYQLTKEPTLRSLQIAFNSLRIMNKIFSKMKADKKRLKNAMTPELFATEKAYKLVKKGVPFREAYRKVAQEFQE